MLFFSRDKRTHELFRRSWHMAADRKHVNVGVMCRGFGSVNFLIAVFRFILGCLECRLIFGASEILIYSMFSRKTDVWVFTGLGRLLLRKGFLSTVVTKTLGSLYRGQLVVVLNDSDSEFIKGFIKCEPVIINGEGYSFTASVTLPILRCSDDVIKFVYVGRLLKSKGVDKLLSAFLVYPNDSWQLLLVGDRDFNNSDSISSDDVEKYTNLLNGRIKFLGFRRDVAQLLKQASVYISMSDREGVPFGVLDAIDAGLFVVLSSVPGHLIFSGLPGVIVLNTDLNQVLTDIDKGVINIYNFDQ